jgi:hypothetical protein
VHRSTSRDPDADGADLPRSLSARVEPNPRATWQAPGAGEPEIGERVDEDLFHRVHVGRDRASDERHGDDRVADELARAVVGDVAAAVGSLVLGTVHARLCEKVLGTGPHPKRVDVAVLEQEQVLRVAVPEERVLHRECVAIADATKPADVKRTSIHRRQPL